MQFIQNFRIRALAALLLFTSMPTPAQTSIASLDFDPQRDGLGFKNYRNEGDRWKDDLQPDDLVRMFGPRTSCASLDGGRCNLLNPAADQWKQEMLDAMDTGRCEGIAAACLRLRAGMPFKGKASPTAFQPNVQKVFGLSRTNDLENYIASFWVTQTFDEVKKLTAQTAAAGPVKIAQTLFSAFRNKTETYVLRFAKFEPKTNRITEPHAVLPFAVEERSDSFVITVYDNNFPGQTRYVTVSKAAPQRWQYNSKPDPKGKADYVGDLSTRTLEITATSWREGRCFASKWRKGVERAGCGFAGNFGRGASFVNASFQQTAETAEFFLTDEGDMLVTDPNGDSLGYDPNEDYFYRDIDGALVSSMIGGFFEDVPHYTVPFIESDTYVYSVLFSGKHLDQESDLDFVYAAPYFTVGLSGIRLDPGETLEANISTNGEQITFISSADGETPEVFYAFDSEDDDKASYFAYVGGVQISRGKSLTLDFDFDNGKLLFSDDDGNEDSYDITLIRVNSDGTVQEYKNDNLNIGTADKYEMDFGDWDGEGDMCFKDDDDADGFADEECEEEPSDGNGGN
ncbi:MAG: hypothetical protein IPJ30_26270 [Acidobacteria bacterium]|nr:hypothetical protein [Acidobacteriota bacterium]